MKRAIVMYGPPGSGKGTQANLLAWKYGLIHFDTGKKLRGILYDPANQNDQIIKRERELNESGTLNTPSWVLSLLKEETEKIASADLGIVYSGSPRTLYEAFGDEKDIGMIQFLDGKYGAENVHIFYLDISPETALARNEVRRVCKVCGTGVLASANIDSCPICAGEMIQRIDDSPEIKKQRIAQYQERTFPILEKLKGQGRGIITIDGSQPPYTVFADIEKALSV